MQNHERSKGRVVACANEELLKQSLQILQQPEKSLLPLQENVASLLFGFMAGEVIAHIGM